MYRFTAIMLVLMTFLAPAQAQDDVIVTPLVYQDLLRSSWMNSYLSMFPKRMFSGLYADDSQYLAELSRFASRVDPTVPLIGP